MKLKKGALILICTLLCVTMIFCSCNKNKEEENSTGSISDWIVSNPDYTDDGSKVFTTLNEEVFSISDDKNVSIFSYNDYFIGVSVSEDRVYAADGWNYTQKTTKTVYDAKTGEVIFKYDGSNSLIEDNFSSNQASIRFLSEGAFVVTETIEKTDEDDKVTVTLYDATGAEIDSTDDADSVSEVYGDFIAINQTAYAIKDGKVTEAFNTEFISLSGIQSISKKHGDYMYTSKNSSYTGAEQIAVLKNYEVVHTYDFPSDSDEKIWHVLNNGNVFIQYTVLLDPDVTEFDYEVLNDDGIDYAKYDLVSLIWDIETNQTTELGLDYIVAYLYSHTALKEADVFDGAKFILSDDAENIAGLLKIENKRPDENNIGVVFVDNNLQVKFDMTDVVENQEKASAPDPIAKNLYSITLNSGEKWAINGSGEKLFKLPRNIEFINNNYVVSSNHIYAMGKDGVSSVLDLNKGDYTVEKITSSAIILKKHKEDSTTTTYYAFDVTAEGSSPKQIALIGENQEFTFIGDEYYNSKADYFITREYNYELDITSKYTLYNAKGEALLTSENSIEVMMSTDNMLVVSTYNSEGKTSITAFTK